MASDQQAETMTKGNWRLVSRIGLACIVACVIVVSGKGESKAAEEENKPSLTVDLGKGITMEFVLVPAGNVHDGFGEGRQ